MLAEPITAVIDDLPPELPDLTTRKPKQPPKPTLPPRHLAGPNGSFVYGEFDPATETWQYSCIGAAGVTTPHDSSQAAKTAYKALACRHRA